MLCLRHSVGYFLCGPECRSAQIELQGDLDHPVFAHRTHRIDAWDAGKLPLQRCCDRTCHGFRARAGQLRRHHHYGKTHIGQ